MTAIRNWLVFSALFFCHLGRTEAMAPSGENWFTIRTPHFRVHHTAPLEIYARALARSFETALPEIEKRLAWKAPSPIDIVVADPTDSANGDRKSTRLNSSHT